MRPIFVGRTEELKQLKASWQLAKQGKPQIVVLKADSGLGKTRILQHFYSWISKPSNGDDPEAYWPDNLEIASNSLNINPDFSQYQSAGKIPWLWWGIRFNKPAQRNQLEISECAMVNALLKLEPHFLPLLEAQEKQRLTGDSANHMVNAMLGLMGLGILSGALAAKDAYNTYREEQKRKNKSALEELEQEKIQDIKDTIKSYFAALMDRNNKAIRSTPIILVLDDAQWSDTDTLIFVEWLYKESIKHAYPLLILVSHWKQEWNIQEQACSHSKMTEAPESFSHLIKRNQPPLTKNNYQMIELGKLADQYLQKLLQNLLPGITTEQQRLLLEIADGVPVYLEQLILYLQSNPKYFKQKNIQGELSDNACKYIKTLTINQENSFDVLCNARFKALEPSLQEILGWCSHQGLRFVREFSFSLAKRINQLNPGPENDLKKATNPFSIIESINEFSSEFCHRELHRAAYNDLIEFGENGEQYLLFKEAFLLELLEWQQQGHIESLEPTEQISLLMLLINELNQKDSLSNEQVQSQGKAILDLIVIYEQLNQPREVCQVALILVDFSRKYKWIPDKDKFSAFDYAGIALIQFSQLDGAISLFSEIIEFEKKYLSDDNKQNTLAAAYTIRGVAYNEQGNNEAAISDYNQAIGFRENLRNTLAEQWPAGMQHDLASVYMNRGNAYSEQGNKEAAISDYLIAIKILSALTLSYLASNALLALIVALNQEIVTNLKEQPVLNDLQAEDLIVTVQDFLERAQDNHLSTTVENQQYLQHLTELTKEVSVFVERHA